MGYGPQSTTSTLVCGLFRTKGATELHGRDEVYGMEFEGSFWCHPSGSMCVQPTTMERGSEGYSSKAIPTERNNILVKKGYCPIYELSYSHACTL